MAADIVYLTNTSLVDDQVDGLAVILHIQPVADIFTGTIDRKRLIIQCICDHQRDQLLRKVIWSVVVRAAADGNRQSVGSVICQYQKVCTGFG